MIEQFPLTSHNQNLVERDFYRFSQAFSDILLGKIPTAKSVDFIINESQLAALILEKEMTSDLLPLFRSLCKNGEDYVIYRDILFIPFNLLNGGVAVAVIAKLDLQFGKRVGSDWLNDLRSEATRDFLLLKQSRVDESTGLFNRSNLYALLNNATNRPVQLVLIEMVVKRFSFQLLANHLRKCAMSIETFLPDGAIAHYLGDGVFAVVSDLLHGGSKGQLATSLVAYLKAEGFSHVHVGASCYNCDNFGKVVGKPGHQLLDEAWTALRVAAKRGPFGFCDYAHLASPKDHPLVRPGKNITGIFRRLWRKSEQFCLVHFRSDNTTHNALEIIGPYLDRADGIEDGADFIVYLEKGKGDVVLQWTEEIVRRCKEAEGNKTVSAGVSCFPYSDFKKSEILYNCRKALAHAAFFGNAGVALFDAVSLNISGDIYFSDGDLTRAVKEYRRGLKCDEKDVNLYNSLGVTFAMMNKLSEAMSCFRKALQLEGDNFMALYNIGLGEQQNNQKSEALSFFQKALSCESDKTVKDPGLKNELRRQIGLLASETGEFQLALDYLLPWYESCAQEKQTGSVVYNIGLSFRGLGHGREAMEWLQKALRCNEYDARAMHLLGLVYHEEGEGDDIAISLCQKSVELVPDNMEYRLELAKMQLKGNMFFEAGDNLKQCLKDQALQDDARLNLARCCLEIGHLKRAANWFNKVRAEGKQDSELYVYLKQRLEV